MAPGPNIVHFLARISLNFLLNCTIMKRSYKRVGKFTPQKLYRIDTCSQSHETILDKFTHTFCKLDHFINNQYLLYRNKNIWLLKKRVNLPLQKV
jgi:hypothetical protein